MNLRKNRIHQHGATNLDYRSTSKDSDPRTSLSPLQQTRLDLLSIPKSNKFDEIVKKRIIKTAPNPFNVTQTLYSQDKKEMMHEKTKMGYPRVKQLEKLGKNIFTGDSNIIYDERIYSKYDFVKYTEEKKEKLNLIKSKHEKHGAAIQETQLVGLDQYNLETLEGRVDIEKVKEIRRAIRRKYGARGNLQKIFNLWDADHKGAVSVQNVLDMIRRFGINMNENEARVLVASSDHDKTNDLNLDEFLEMIFTDNEALNVDLKSIPVLSENDMKKVNEVMQVTNNEQRMSQHRNKVNLILNNKLTQIARGCIEADFKKEGWIDYDRLHHHLRQIGFTEQTLPDPDIHAIFDKYKINENKFNYKLFLKELKEFEYKSTDLRFEKAETLIQKPRDNTQLSAVQKRLNLYNTEEDPLKFTVLDNLQVPVSKLNQIRSSAKKVFRSIYKYFDSETDFKQKFLEVVKAEPDNTIPEDLVSKQILTKFVSEFFQQKPHEKIDKKDIECFLSNFSYNKHGYTQMSVIPSLIYQEEDVDFYKRVAIRRPGPAPPLCISTSKENDSASKEPPIENPSSLEVEKVFKKIEDRLFRGRTKALKIFELFDVDKDGYITHDDMVKKIKEMNLLEPEEIPCFLAYVDPQNKKSLNFHDFSSKVRPNALSTDELGRQTYIPYTNPAQEITESLRKSLPNIKESVLTSKVTFTPSSKDEYKPATRFGATPEHKNTFYNYQGKEPINPMTISAFDRFNRGLIATTKFQADEKKDRETKDLAKLENIRKYQQTIMQKVEDERNRLTQRDLSKVKAMGLAQWSYEHVSLEERLALAWNQEKASPI